MAFKYYAFHKPYGYLSQFSDEGRWKGLKHILNVDTSVYPIGRLDADSEGLLLLSNDKEINAELLHPKKKHKRKYLVQVDGCITDHAIHLLNQPLELNIKSKIHVTKGNLAQKTVAPNFITDREPPVRFRKEIPTSWLTLTLTEGKNRQVRKMTAAVGFPTLRLIRLSIEEIHIQEISRGEIKEFTEQEFKSMLRLNKVRK